MTHRVLAWAESEDRTDNTLTNIRTALEDRYGTIGDDNDEWEFDADSPAILMAYFGQDQADDFQRARITSPSIAEAPLDFVRGYDAQITRSQADSVYDWRTTPYRAIPPSEGVEVLISEAGGAVAVDAWGVLIVGDKAIPKADSPPEAITHIISGTYSVGNTVALQWTRFTLTVNSVLPAGKYRMWGAQNFLTTGISVRYIFNGLKHPVPIIPCRHESDRPHQYNYYWGHAVEFPHDRLPAVECLTEAAEDPVDQGYELYLTKVS